MSLLPHQLFTLAAVNQTFSRDGYALMPLLDAWEVDKLTRLYLNMVPETPTDFFSTAFLPDSHARRRMAEAVGRLLAPHLTALLPGYTLCSRAFVAKRGGPGQLPLPLHQDYSYVDPAAHSAIHVWIPLVDVDASNGCLTAVPGSHNAARHLSALNTNPSPWDAVRGTLDNECKLTLPMPRGHAFFFDQRLLHGSSANTRPAVRIALVLALLPTGVRQRLYVVDAHNPAKLNVLEIRDEFALSLGPGTTVEPPYPDGIVQIDTVDYLPEPIPPAALDRLRVRPPRATATSATLQPPAAAPVWSRLRGLVRGNFRTSA